MDWRCFPVSRVPSLCIIVILCSGLASASCGICACSPQWVYPPDYYGGCFGSACPYLCPNSYKLTAQLQVWNPRSAGFLTSPQETGEVVTVVYPNSPAASAGLRTGDVLVALDGAPVSKICSRKFDEAEFHDYAVRRGKETKVVRISSVPLSAMVAMATLSPTVVTVGFHSGDNDRSHVLYPTHPYVSGLKILRASSGMKVAAVLPGSPADRAGFEKGARILAVQEVSNGEPSTLVEGADYRASLRITFLQEGAIHRETLVLQSLTELLDDLDGNDRNQLVNAKFVTVR